MTALPAGDPAKPVWTYGDLAAVFDLSEDTVRRKMAGWEAEGFPAPLPWNQYRKKWKPSPVIAWKQRRERALRADPVELELVEGGAGV